MCVYYVYIFYIQNDLVHDINNVSHMMYSKGDCYISNRIILYTLLYMISRSYVVQCTMYDVRRT